MISSCRRGRGREQMVRSCGAGRRRACAGGSPVVSLVTAWLRIESDTEVPQRGITVIEVYF